LWGWYQPYFYRKVRKELSYLPNNREHLLHLLNCDIISLRTLRVKYDKHLTPYSLARICNPCLLIILSFVYGARITNPRQRRVKYDKHLSPYSLARICNPCLLIILSLVYGARITNPRQRRVKYDRYLTPDPSPLCPLALLCPQVTLRYTCGYATFVPAGLSNGNIPLTSLLQCAKNAAGVKLCITVCKRSAAYGTKGRWLEVRLKEKSKIINLKS
jgi:hypothetical protein